MGIVVRGQWSVVCGILEGDHPIRRFYNEQRTTDKYMYKTKRPLMAKYISIRGCACLLQAGPAGKHDDLFQFNPYKYRPGIHARYAVCDKEYLSFCPVVLRMDIHCCDKLTGLFCDVFKYHLRLSKRPPR